MSSVPLSSSGSSRKVRVFIADRNLMSGQLLAEVLSRDPRFHVMVVGNEAELTAAAAKSSPDVVVLSSDFGSGTDSGMRITRCFNQRYPAVRLIILMEEPSRDAVLDAFRCGASGVFSRTKPVNDFLTCIDRVSQGEIWASRGELDYLLTSLRGMPGSRMVGCENMSVLSKRELEVVKLAAEGHTNKDIADEMRLSEHTVKNYLFRACDKIGVSSRGELLFYLLQQGDAPSNVVPMEAMAADLLPKYHKAADEGWVAAQFILGLAHYEGAGIEKDDRSAYYWLRLAEQNANEILRRSDSLLHELKQKINSEDIQQIESTVARDKRQGPQLDRLTTLLKGKRRAGSSKIAV